MGYTLAGRVRRRPANDAIAQEIADDLYAPRFKRADELANCAESSSA
jgi:hypothetical protein